MDWIYLSPHLDDVALSCGGLVWEQAQAGKEIGMWTICAGDIPPGSLSPFAQSLHDRWEKGHTAVIERRREDQRACELLGATVRHFAIPDCIYRRDPESGASLYDSEESLWGELHPAEAGLVEHLSGVFSEKIPAGVQLVAPLALGGHVDHRLVRAAAESTGRRLWYYTDYPYILETGEHTWELLEELEHVDLAVSEAGLAVWVAAVAANVSQISTFWPDQEAMAAAIRAYHGRVGGVRLFKNDKGAFTPGRVSGGGIAGL